MSSRGVRSDGGGRRWGFHGCKIPARARLKTARYTCPREHSAMSIRPIVRLGHPALRIVAEPVGAGTLAEPATQELIDDMIDTMRSAHGVGLAAPQIAVLSQIFVYEVAPLSRMRQ